MRLSYKVFMTAALIIIALLGIATYLMRLMGVPAAVSARARA